MPLPISVKIKKDGVEYENNVNAVQWTLSELIRAALRDCGKLICRRTKTKVKKRTGRGIKNIQYWVRSKQETPDLLVGLKPGGFYLGFQELGTYKSPKLSFLTDTTRENIDEMQRIQAQYLSGIDAPAPSIPISEDDYEGGGDD